MKKNKTLKNLIVSMRAYKGNQILKDINGNIANEKEDLTLEYESNSWENLMSTLHQKGFFKVDLLKAFNQYSHFDEDGDFICKEEDLEEETIEKIKMDIDNNLKKTDRVLSPEEQKIKEQDEQIKQLKSQMAEMQASIKKPKQRLKKED